VGEMKFPAALSKTSTLPKFSKLLVAFSTSHNDVHHIESVGMFQPVSVSSSVFLSFSISLEVMATCGSNSKKYLVIAFLNRPGYDNFCLLGHRRVTFYLYSSYILIFFIVNIIKLNSMHA
jgi:hypothetical protein